MPRSVVILYPILGSAFVWGTRQVAGWMLKSVGIEIPVRVREKVTNVLIYGAGTTGVQLLEELRRSGTYEPIGFIDMSPTLWGQYVAGLKVYRPERLACDRAAPATCAKCCWRCRRPGGGSGRPRCGSSSL